MAHRCDPYGNIVSRDAKSESLCAFELDHVFPWSRGGLSVPANFMAVHFGANRHVKRSKVRNAMTEEEVESMQTGLSVEQFLELVDRVVSFQWALLGVCLCSDGNACDFHAVSLCKNISIGGWVAMSSASVMSDAGAKQVCQMQASMRSASYRH